MSFIMISEKNEISSEPFDPAYINENNVRRIIEREQNPSPLLLFVFFTILLIFMYYIYVGVIKECFNGRWYSSTGDIYVIKHNRWSDNVSVGGIKGYVSGGGIYLFDGNIMYTGALKNNNIYWIGGDIWRRGVYIE